MPPSKKPRTQSAHAGLDYVDAERARAALPELQEVLAKVTAAYERKKTEVAELQKRVSETSATVLSDQRNVSVTVGPRGEVTELKFLNQDYKKMAPAELSRLITKAIKKAAAEAGKKVDEIMAPSLPPGFDMKSLRSGSVDIKEFANQLSKMKEG